MARRCPLLKQEKCRPATADSYPADHVWSNARDEEPSDQNPQSGSSGHFQSIRSRAFGGDAEAQRLLALILELGLGDEPDESAASEWYMRAALRGLVAAQFQLARLYIEGRGVPRDFVSAYVWMALAGRSGHQTARTLLPLLMRFLSRKQLLEASERIAALRIPGEDKSGR